MQILIIVNDSLGPPSLIGDEIILRGGYYDVCMPHAEKTGPLVSHRLPASHRGYDGLVIMGGTMDAFDHQGYPAFLPLQQLIRDFHEVEKPVLGICLGAQLIALAFGAQVYRHTQPEIGFIPIELTDAAQHDVLLKDLSKAQTIMQWHQDTFDLPASAELLMSGSACRHQVFRIGTSTYAFQCHFEVTLDLLRDWLCHASDPAPDLLLTMEDQIREHLAAAMVFGQTVTRRWLNLLTSRSEKVS